MLPQEELEELARIHHDPLRFTRFYWPQIKLYDKQAQILNSVRENKWTFVHAGTTLGKDFISSLAALWFFRSRNPCKVIISSSSEDHLRTVLWGEIQERLNTAEATWKGQPVDLPFKVDDLRVRLYTDAARTQLDPQSWIEGRVTNKVETFQGVHLDQDRPRILAIFDEASGIDSAFFRAATGWAHRILIIGNPLNITNFFYHNCKQGDLEDPAGQNKLLRKVIHIGALDSPNVQWGLKCKEAGIDPIPPVPEDIRIPGLVNYEEYVQRLATWEEFDVTARLHGRFYEDPASLLYPPEWLDAAEAAHLELERNETNRRAKVIGIDGGEGRANSVWTVVDELGIIEQLAIKTPDTMMIAGRTIELMRRHGVPPEKVYIDRGGGGKQIADRLAEQGYRINQVSFGEAPTPPMEVKTKRMDQRRQVYDVRKTYKNRRAEMFGMLRDEINPLEASEEDGIWLRVPKKRIFAIPAILTELRTELAPLPLLYDSEGVMFLPPKSHPAGVKKSNVVTIQEILGRSPDRADSLVLAVFGLKARSRRKIGALAG